MLRNKFRSYLLTMLMLSISCLVLYLFTVKAAFEDYDDGGEQSVEYKGEYVSFVFYDSGMVLRFSILTGAAALFLFAAGFVFTLFYAGNSVKSINASLSCLRTMTDEIRRGKYDFPEFQETIVEFRQVEDAFRFMGASIKDQIEKTRESEDIRKRLMLDISHDLKNPLMSLAGYVELMAADAGGRHRERHLKIIDENIRRANRMVADLFELAKMESMERRMAMEEVDIAEVVKSVLIERLDELQYNGIELLLAIRGEERWILGNEAALRRALANILDNAIHYHKDGSALRIGCEERNDTVFLTFSNTSELRLKGEGDLLEPFVRLEGSGRLNAQGTGLGLSIVSKIIQAHGGMVRLNASQEGDFSVIIDIPTLRRA